MDIRSNYHVQRNQLELIVKNSSLENYHVDIHLRSDVVLILIKCSVPFLARLYLNVDTTVYGDATLKIQITATMNATNRVHD